MTFIFDVNRLPDHRHFIGIEICVRKQLVQHLITFTCGYPT
jgi:hypothetical protein